MLHLGCGTAQRKHFLLSVYRHLVRCDLTTDKILIPADVDIAIGPGLLQIVNFQLLNLFLDMLNVSFEGQFLRE